jgi:hypothetical protein
MITHHTRPAAPLTVAVITASLLVGCAPRSRFHRLVEQYRDPDYRAADRDIVFDFGYDSHAEEFEPAGLGLTEAHDEYRYCRREFDNDTRVSLRSYYGDSVRLRSHSVDAGAEGEYSRLSEVRSNKLIGKADTIDRIDRMATAYGRYNTEWTRYVPRKRKPGTWRGWRLGGGLGVKAGREVTKRYIHERLHGITAMRRIQEENRAWAWLDLWPTFVRGRQRPVTPLYRAFEVERLLRKRGAAHGELADTTLLALATRFATAFVHDVRHDRGEKYFYDALEPILAADPACDTARLDAYTLFRIKQSVDTRYPAVFVGPEFTLSAWQSLRVSYRREHVESSADTLTEGIRDVWPGIQFDQANALFRPAVSWGMPLSPRLFLSLRCAMDFFGSSDDTYVSGGLVAVSDGDVRGWLVEQTWNVHLCYWTTDRLLLEAGALDIPAALVVPREPPRSSSVVLRYFVEDHLSLDVGFEKTFVTRVTRDTGAGYVPARKGSGFWELDGAVEQDTKITVGLGYDF